jgi:hypothetical protein
VNELWALGRRTVRRGWYDLRTLVAPYPILALPAARLRHGVPVGTDTQIVIEGFPRTANTFAVVAFTMAQSEPVAVAAHVHAPAQLIAAAERGIPAIALIREPEPTVLSFAIRHPEIGVRHGLSGYVRFYEALVPYRDRFVVGRFSDVTSDFGSVIRRVNERFGTGFGVFEHTDENVRRSFEEIDRGYAGREDRGAAFESIVPRPSDERERVKETLRAEYRAQRSARMRARAETVYRALASDGLNER